MSSAEIQKQLVDLIRSVPGNNICADCRDQNPTWTSTNLGVFVCLECSAIHRAMGVHISKVKSTTLDKWNKPLYEGMKSAGNIKANNYWEANLPSHVPRPRTLQDREKFIRDKYQHKKYIRTANSAASSNNVASSNNNNNLSSSPIATSHAKKSKRITPAERRRREQAAAALQASETAVATAATTHAASTDALIESTDLLSLNNNNQTTHDSNTNSNNLFANMNVKSSFDSTASADDGGMDNNMFANMQVKASTAPKTNQQDIMNMFSTSTTNAAAAHPANQTTNNLADLHSNPNITQQRQQDPYALLNSAPPPESFSQFNFINSAADTVTLPSIESQLNTTQQITSNQMEMNQSSTIDNMMMPVDNELSNNQQNDQFQQLEDIATSISDIQLKVINIQNKIFEFEKAREELILHKNELAQLNGTIDDIQMKQLDSIIAHNNAEVAAYRKTLNQQASQTVEAIKVAHTRCSVILQPVNSA